VKYKTLAERVAARQRYRETAIAKAAMIGLSARCAYSSNDLDHTDHQLCQGEEKTGAGCLCHCHDRDFS
jgi:hypothetical protein